jgi:capsular polysaccharide biosynthesis protein
MAHNDQCVTGMDLDRERSRMSVSESSLPAGPGLLRWGLRRYALMVLASVLLVTVALPWALRQGADETYETQALVVAQTSEMPLAALPRYAEAVFYNGAVARQVAAALNVPGDPLDLVPSRLHVVTAQDSIVMTVVGRHADPSVAAQLANEAATAYITELNRPGPELGVFTLQSAAAPPVQPVESGPGTAIGLVIGGLAGAALGLGLLGLVLNARRPVVDAPRFESLVGAPVLSVLSLPRGSNRDSDPRTVVGLPPLVRHLAALPQGEVHVVSQSGLDTQRSTVAALLATALARWRPTSLLPAAPDGDSRSTASERARGRRQQLLIVDVASPLDAAPDSRHASTLLLFEEGAPEAAVLRAVAEHSDADVLGVVLLRKAGLFVRRARPEPVVDEAPSASAPELVEGEPALGEPADTRAG